MTGHTPGPWRVVRYRRPDTLRIHHNTGYEIVPITKICNPENEYAEANAKLIAAAPDLLEALKLATSCIGDLGRNPRALAVNSSRVIIVEKLEAAILKADWRGR